MDTIVLSHKTHGECYADAAEFHSSKPMIKVKLKTPVVLPKQGAVQSLTVGKGAIKEKSEGYVPQHRHKTLAERFIPLANKLASKAWRAGRGDNYELYEELQCVAYEALVKAANRYNGDIGSFQAFATSWIENEFRDYWRKEAKTNGTLNFDGDWDAILPPEDTMDNDKVTRVELAVKKLRPRLRELITMMYMSDDDPKTTKEMAYRWNVDPSRIRQLKQEAIKEIKAELGIT